MHELFSEERTSLQRTTISPGKESHKAKSMITHIPMAPGARIVVRDEEWLVRRVDPASDGGHRGPVRGLGFQ